MAGIASAVRKRRKQADLTISQLAELAGIDAGFLAYIETGKKMPSLLTAAKLAKALDIPLSELFRDVPQQRAAPEYKLKQRLNSLFHDRTPVQKAELLDVLKELENPRRVKALRQIIRK